MKIWGVRIEPGAPYVALDKLEGVSHFKERGNDVIMLHSFDRRMRLI